MDEKKRNILVFIILGLGVFAACKSYAAGAQSPVITGTYNTPSIQAYSKNGDPLAQIAAAKLIGHPVLSKNPDTDMIAVKTDDGIVYLTEDSVEANIQAAAPTPTHCVHLGAASSDEIAGTTNNLARSCNGS
ncbi:MAG TPA: hypothetical protein DEP42_04015 [Ruminococcaceae bacterium]|nr:hypothetical protein [Oscillospiraceae bacterium]